MAASSRAQVLRLYRALLRESQRFSGYNYRCCSSRRSGKGNNGEPRGTGLAVFKSLLRCPLAWLHSLYHSVEPQRHVSYLRCESSPGLQELLSWKQKALNWHNHSKLCDPQGISVISCARVL
uniref:Complex 1 LYR protein domain-containing protein n=1 Tax=Pavo cristatus TaxID=9049 RepID=A0A8C9EG31_PAVCR